MSKRIAAQRIEAHRVRLGLSPEQYGIRIGVSGQTVRNVEAGRVPFLSTQKKFADAQEMEIGELFPRPAAPARRTVRRAVMA